MVSSNGAQGLLTNRDPIKGEQFFFPHSRKRYGKYKAHLHLAINVNSWAIGYLVTLYPIKESQIKNKVVICVTALWASLELADSLQRETAFHRPIQLPTGVFPFFFLSTSSYKSILSLRLYSKKHLLSSDLNLVFGFLFLCFGYDSHTFLISFMSEQFSISEH